MSSLDNSMSHKGEKRRNYTMEFKRAAIEYAEKNSNYKAAENFRVSVKPIREQRQNNLKIFEPIIKRKNRRLGGSGRKQRDQQSENQLVQQIYDRRYNGLRVSRKLIMAKVKYSYKSECDESEKSFLVTGNGWVNNFMRCNGFSLHRKTTKTQQDPERLIDKLI